MNTKKTMLFFLFTLGMICFGQPHQSLADSTQVLEGMDFAYEVEQPENQIDKRVSYFDLLVKPSQEQKLKVHLKNSRDKKTVIKLSFNRAQTNAVGETIYSRNTKGKLQDDLEVNIENVVSISDSKVELAPLEKKDVTVTINVPKNSFTGIIAGAIYMEQERSTSSGNITNLFSRELGIVLRESDTVIQPNLQLKKVKPGTENSHTVIEAYLVNNQPTFLRDLKVVTKIDKEGQDKPVLSKKEENFKVAPNSEFRYILPITQGDEIKPGDYKVSIQASSGEKKWDLHSSFTIDRAEAKKVNEQSIDIVKDNKKWWLLIMGIVIALVLIVLVVYLAKTKKKLKIVEQQNNAEQQNNSDSEIKDE